LTQLFTELPVPTNQRFPSEVLKQKILKEPFDVSAYTVDGGKFVVTALTPVLIGKSQAQQELQQAANRYNRRGKKIKDEPSDPIHAPFYDWMRTAGRFMESVVTLEIKPQFGATTGSVWAAAVVRHNRVGRRSY
jgi:hypothetical protein